MDVISVPVLGNEYHAEITGWSDQKDERMAVAKLLCSMAEIGHRP